MWCVRGSLVLGPVGSDSSCCVGDGGVDIGNKRTLVLWALWMLCRVSFVYRGPCDCGSGPGSVREVQAVRSMKYD